MQLTVQRGSVRVFGFVLDAQHGPVDLHSPLWNLTALLAFEAFEPEDVRYAAGASLRRF